MAQEQLDDIFGKDTVEAYKAISHSVSQLTKTPIRVDGVPHMLEEHAGLGMMEPVSEADVKKPQTKDEKGLKNALGMQLPGSGDSKSDTYLELKSDVSSYTVAMLSMAADKAESLPESDRQSSDPKIRTFGREIVENLAKTVDASQRAELDNQLNAAAAAHEDRLQGTPVHVAVAQRKQIQALARIADLQTQHLAHEAGNYYKASHQEAAPEKAEAPQSRPVDDFSRSVSQLEGVSPTAAKNMQYLVSVMDSSKEIGGMAQNHAVQGNRARATDAVLNLATADAIADAEAARGTGRQGDAEKSLAAFLGDNATVAAFYAPGSAERHAEARENLQTAIRAKIQEDATIAVQSGVRAENLETSLPAQARAMSGELRTVNPAAAQNLEVARAIEMEKAGLGNVDPDVLNKAVDSMLKLIRTDAVVGAVAHNGAVTTNAGLEALNGTNRPGLAPAENSVGNFVTSNGGDGAKARQAFKDSGTIDEHNKDAARIALGDAVENAARQAIGAGVSGASSAQQPQQPPIVPNAPQGNQLQR